MRYSISDQKNKCINVIAPMSGFILPIEHAIHHGFVINSQNNNLLLAPIAGIITDLNKGNHTLTITTNLGVEFVIHVYIINATKNNVKFVFQRAVNDKVNTGDPLVNWYAPTLNSGLTAKVLVTTDQIGDICYNVKKRVTAGKTVVFKIHTAMNSSFQVATQAHKPSYSNTEITKEKLLTCYDDNKLPLIKGIGASRGNIIGIIAHKYKDIPDLPKDSMLTIVQELTILESGIIRSQHKLNVLIKELARERNSLYKDLFFAHKQLLNDYTITNGAKNLIKQGKTAIWSWYKSYSEKASELRKLNNQLLASRADDIEDIGFRVLRCLVSLEEHNPELTDNTILCCDHITPSELMAIDKNKVSAICTLSGSAASHVAILANSLNIPYIAALDRSIRAINNGTKVIFNANNGYIYIAPTNKEIHFFCKKQLKQTANNNEAILNKNKPAITKDNRRIVVAANIANLKEVNLAKNLGAEGLGLVRSEFIFMDKKYYPDENEQQSIYKKIIETIDTKYPVVIRTLDVGGDKKIPYLATKKEENPSLGERGIRVALNKPSIFNQQIKAILRATTATIHILLPMISSIIELRTIKKLIAQEMTIFSKEYSIAPKVKLGIMVEIPSVAILADQFVTEVDFFSIGSNDLTQYTLAVDRNNAVLAELVDSLNPAVLKLIKNIVTAAKNHNKWVSVCGNMAMDNTAIPILIGLGVDELSVPAVNIPLIKQQIRNLNFTKCQDVARQSLVADSAMNVRKLVKDNIKVA